jgi:hypothetical protein
VRPARPASGGGEPGAATRQITPAEQHGSEQEHGRWQRHRRGRQVRELECVRGRDELDLVEDQIGDRNEGRADANLSPSQRREENRRDFIAV